MPKGVKIGIGVVVVVVVLLGGAYGLAKIGVIPVASLARKNKAFGSALQVLGLYKPKPAVAAAHAPVPDPLAGEKKALQAQREALNQERATWQSQVEAKMRADTNARLAVQNAAPDPKNIARMASVYEQMPPETVTKIFTKLPDDQVIGLLRRMDEKPVAQILAAVTPERAARLTLALSRPAPPPTDRTASNTP